MTDAVTREAVNVFVIMFAIHLRPSKLNHFFVFVECGKQSKNGSYTHPFIHPWLKQILFLPCFSWYIVLVKVFKKESIFRWWNISLQKNQQHFICSLGKYKQNNKCYMNFNCTICNACKVFEHSKFSCDYICKIWEGTPWPIWIAW